jgi:uncharacterized membrane protein YraQ (UPF0718 family)
MDIPTLILWVIALIVGAIAFFRPGKLHIQGMKRSLEYVLIMFPRILMALLISGFFSVILPADLVAAWLGKEAGLRGILIASLVGGFTPGGPLISFPIVFILFQNGAAIPPIIAFLTAWSVFGFHRIIAYEIPLVGVRFVAVRILSSVILPPLAGILALLIEAHVTLGT